MGRGRAKAKQTKVARELKYFSPDTDLTRLSKNCTGPPTRSRNLFPTAPWARTSTTNTGSGPRVSSDLMS